MFQFIVLLVLSLIAAGAISTGAKDFIKNLLVIGGVIFFAQLAGNPFHQAFDQGVPIAGGSGLTQKNVSLKLPDKPPESLRGKVRFWAAQYRVDPQLFFALVTQESAWNPQAVSHAGAIGLGQVMPFNAPGCGLKKADLYHPDKNLMCSGKILKEALVYWDRRFPQDADKAIRHALGEYNAGRTAVIERNAMTAFPETRQYVARIMANYEPTLGLISKI